MEFRLRTHQFSLIKNYIVFVFFVFGFINYGSASRSIGSTGRHLIPHEADEEDSEQDEHHQLYGGHHGHDTEDLEHHFSDTSAGFHDDGLIGQHINHHSSGLQQQGSCEPIKIGLCMELGYNETTMPNLIGHDLQTDADALLQTFTPLIQYGCSPHLKLFLCSAFVPMCTDKTPQPIGPCRSLCESVRGSCEPVLSEFGFKWPPSLVCSKFYPENNHQHMCIPGPIVPDLPVTTGFRLRDSNRQKGSIREDNPLIPNGSKKYAITSQNKNPIIENVPIITSVNPVDFSMSIPCEEPLKFRSKGTCWTKCPFSFPVSEISEFDWTRNYILVTAILTLINSVMALLLSFQSPTFTKAERPILYICLCQMMTSLGTVLGISLPSVSCVVDKSSGIELLAGQGSFTSYCALTFLLTYFFNMASLLWWVILCLIWSLRIVSPSLRISLNSKERGSPHFLCWGISSILTSLALALNRVEADEISGLCGIGFQDLRSSIFYVLVPLGTALTIAGGAFVFGSLGSLLRPTWTSLFRSNSIKSRIQQQRRDESARQNHAYSPVLPPPFDDPTPTFISSYHHHHKHRNHNEFGRRQPFQLSKGPWKRLGFYALIQFIPVTIEVAIISIQLTNYRELISPNPWISVVRITMGLIPGLTAGVWVLLTFPKWQESITSCTFLRECFGPNPKVIGDPAAPSPSSAATTTSPLIIPVPVNSLATSYVTIGGRTGMSSFGIQRPYAGITSPRCHQPTLPPPLPSRTPLDAWRRTETIV